MRSQKYGATLRKLVDAAVKAKKDRYECRKCGKRMVKRISYGIWRCKSCDSTFAGGAYTLTTEAGNLTERFIEELSSKKE